jgi:hypothetical protein
MGRGERTHESAALVHLHHQRLAEEQDPATVEIYHRTAVGPCRVAPLVLLASSRGGCIPQREFRPADQAGRTYWRYPEGYHHLSVPSCRHFCRSASAARTAASLTR